MKHLGWLVALVATASAFAALGTTAAVADPDVVCGQAETSQSGAPDTPEECGGGGGWTCLNVTDDVHQDNGYGSYRMTLTLHFCPNGTQVQNCSVVDPAIYAHTFWYWQGWITEPYIYGGNSSCTEYGQGHFKFARPGWFDDHEYPWLRITGYPNGTHTISKGHD